MSDALYTSREFVRWKSDPFGRTTSREILALVEKWRDDAVADGWSIRPTYDSEDQSRAAKLEKDGFVASLLTRDDDGGGGKKYPFEASIWVWGPDELAINPGVVYDWQTILDGQRKCGYCPATDVDTQRVGFAGRCCAVCRPKVAAELERPGWCD